MKEVELLKEPSDVDVAVNMDDGKRPPEMKENAFRIRQEDGICCCATRQRCKGVEVNGHYHYETLLMLTG